MSIEPTVHGPAPPARQDFPGIVAPLVTERDLFMAYLLRKMAGLAPRVVVVVGAGHLAGIRCGLESGGGGAGLPRACDAMPLASRLTGGALVGVTPPAIVTGSTGRMRLTSSR